ncbi:MAG: type II toxin-antitoxin system Phd/YefM family antitoxin [Miltoncostaeaceae bacterium]
MATRTIAITEVKAKLLKLVTEIGETGDEIVITRRGRPIARLVPAASAHPLKGSLVLPDDMAAYDLSAEWAGSDLV